MNIRGLGPHGERAASLDQLVLTDDAREQARLKHPNIAVVLHTTGSDWSRQQLAGLVTTLGEFGASVDEVVDCEFSIDAQKSAIERLVQDRPDAIISLPIGNREVGEAHAAVARAGIKLVLLDNVPTGLLPGTDYVSVVSADNFGLGQIGASLLSSHIPSGGKVIMLTYGVDFFVTNEREIAFRKWIESERPDIDLARVRFPEVDQVTDILGTYLDQNPKGDGLFAVWDAPAMPALDVLRARTLDWPVTTVDLGNDAALDLAAGGAIKGIGAQQPYTQGIAAAKATILSLLDRPVPPWIALPGLAVTAQNVVESYQVVWHAPAPQDLIAARRQTLNAGQPKLS